jgi:hypothetical protein
MGLFRNRRKERDHLAAAGQLHANTLRHAQVIDEMQRANWALWGLMRSEQARQAGRKNAAEELHEEAHEGDKPWEE